MALGAEGVNTRRVSNAAFANAALVLSFCQQLEAIQSRWGQRRSMHPRRPGPVFSLCCRAGIDAVLVTRVFFGGAPSIENSRVAPVRFGSVTVWGWNGSSSSGFLVPAVPLRRGFLCVSAQLHREDGSWKTVPSVSVRRSVPAKRFRRFRFLVPARFLGHPEIEWCKKSNTKVTPAKGHLTLSE